MQTSEQALTSADLDLGVSITGSKEEIQAQSIGVGLPFPGEPGANARKMTLRKHGRFEEVAIEIETRYDHELGKRVRTGRYRVSAYHVARDRAPRRRKDAYAPGVMRHEDIWGDVFVGTAAALIAAGLIEPHQVPGQPTSGKTMASFAPDGTRVGQGFNSVCWLRGSKQIRRQGSMFSVELRIGEAEGKRRLSIWSAEFDARRDAYRRKCELACSEAPARTHRHLKLVWSQPLTKHSEEVPGANV